MGIIFAVLSAGITGLANLLLKKSFKDFPPSVSFFIFAAFSVLLWAPVGLLLGVNFHNIVFGFSVGLMSAVLAQGIYIYVLEKGELSITGTILGSFAVYTIIFSIVFNNERPSSATLLLIITTIIGTIIVSLPNKVNINELKKIRYILWAVFAAICIGASDTITKFYITKISVGSFLFYASFAQIVVSIIYLRIEKESLNQFKIIHKKIGEYKFSLIGSILISISTLFLFVSFNFLLASIASPIAASAPIITFILALIFLKEKVTIKNLLGLAIVLASIIGLGIVNP
jgi:transporter family protein